MLKIFIASSTAAKSQARAFMEGCIKDASEYVPWWEAFTAGKTLLEDLDDISTSVHGAVIVLTPEAVATTASGTQIPIPNLNVLFEFGYLYSKLGKQNVVVLKYGKVVLPSDLGGYIHVFGSDFFRPSYKVPVSKRTRKEFDRWYDAFVTVRK